MSVVAPINDKDNALDFQERIAIFDSDFRNGLFKLTAMLIRNLDESEDNEHDFRFAAINNSSYVSNPSKESSLDREMVHALTWLPIKMFTTSVMEGAVDCWCWTIIGRPELELLVKQFLKKTRFFFFDRR